MRIESPVALEIVGEPSDAYSTFDDSGNRDTKWPPNLAPAWKKFLKSYFKVTAPETDLRELNPVQRGVITHYLTQDIGIAEAMEELRSAIKDTRARYEDQKTVDPTLIDEIESGGKFRDTLFKATQLMWQKANNTTTKAPSSLKNVKLNRGHIVTAKVSKVAGGIGITALTDEQANVIREQREAEHRRIRTKLETLMATAHDLSPQERQEKPIIGTLFNWASLSGLPEGLIRFYEEHPELEVERWQTIHGKRGGSYVTYSQGKLFYVKRTIGEKERVERLELAPEAIVEFYKTDKNSYADPASFEPFALKTYAQIRMDIEMTAVPHGYNIFAKR